MRRALLVSVLAGILVAAGAVGLIRNVGGTGPAAAIGSVDTGGLTQLRGDDLAGTVTALQEHLRAQPADARGWATLGVAYVEMARLTGDASYYPKAADVLHRSRQITPDDNDLAWRARRRWPRRGTSSDSRCAMRGRRWRSTPISCRRW